MCHFIIIERIENDMTIVLLLVEWKLPYSNLGRYVFQTLDRHSISQKKELVITNFSWLNILDWFWTSWFHGPNTILEDLLCFFLRSWHLYIKCPFSSALYTWKPEPWWFNHFLEWCAPYRQTSELKVIQQVKLGHKSSTYSKRVTYLNRNSFFNRRYFSNWRKFSL